MSSISGKSYRDTIKQSKTKGEPTAWCAKHDHRTLEPQPAHACVYHAIGGPESMGIVKFRMGIENPSPEVFAAIGGAAAWFEEDKITGIRLDQIAVDSLSRGYDLVVVEDDTAPPLWARFCEISTNTPIYANTDGNRRQTSPTSVAPATAG